MGAYDHYTRLSVLADKLGYQAISVSEHHFTEGGWCPTPALPLASIAYLTNRVLLVTGVRLLPLHGPVRVAEEVAVLDVMSRGRAVAGVGLGYREVELKAFNAKQRGRGGVMEEQLRVLDLLLRGEAVTGEYSWGRLEGVRVTPRPVQRPRPSIWVASKVEEGVRRAARLGDAWLADPITPTHILERLSRVYTSEAGGGGNVVLRVDGFLARDEGEEERVLNAILRSYETDYFRWGHLVDKLGQPVSPRDKSFKEVVDVVLERVVVGTRDKFVDRLLSSVERLRAGLVLIRLVFPGIDYKLVEESVRRISREVVER